MVTLDDGVPRIASLLRIGLRPRLVTLENRFTYRPVGLRIGLRPRLVTLRNGNVDHDAAVADWSQAKIGYTGRA